MQVSLHDIYHLWVATAFFVLDKTMKRNIEKGYSYTKLLRNEPSILWGAMLSGTSVVLQGSVFVVLSAQVP